MSDSAPKILADVWNENDCGDPACKERRLVAALHVLKGGATHLQYAELLERTVGTHPEEAIPPVVKHPVA